MKKAQIKTMNRVQAVNLSKKGQIKMAENMAIMIVFFLLVVIALIFYAKISRQTTLLEEEKFSVLRAIKIAENVAYLPEVRCSEENTITADCFDLYKLDAARQVITANKEFYNPMLSTSKVSIKAYYPLEYNYTLYDNPPEGSYDELPTQIPITLYDAKNGVYLYGILEVRVYKA